MTILADYEALPCSKLCIHPHCHSDSGKLHIATVPSQVKYGNRGLHNLHNFGSDGDHVVLFEDLVKSHSQGKQVPQTGYVCQFLLFQYNT
jgi:hypothetical protein